MPLPLLLPLPKERAMMYLAMPDPMRNSWLVGTGVLSPIGCPHSTQQAHRSTTSERSNHAQNYCYGLAPKLRTANFVRVPDVTISTLCILAGLGALKLAQKSKLLEVTALRDFLLNLRCEISNLEQLGLFILGC